MPDKDLTIRFYKSGDEISINRLFEAAFHINRSRKEWKWKFQDNPLGESIIIVGELDKKIIAHIAAIPTGVKIKDEAIICYQIVDSMADPSANTRLIYSRLFRRMQEQVEGMQLMDFGFANIRSHGLLVTRRLGARSLGKVDMFLAKVSSVLTEFPRIKKRKFSLSEVNKFDDRFTDLWEGLSAGYNIAVVRKKQYLNWRYVGRPGHNYKIFSLGGNEIKGYIVLKIHESNGLKIGNIIDLLAPKDTSVISDMLENALIYFDSKEVNLAVSYHRDKFLSQCLSGFGFSPVSGTDYGGEFAEMWLMARNFCPKVADQVLLDQENWFIMMGDSDWM